MKQHASHRLLDAILGFGSGVADILANEIVARDAHHLLASNAAEAMQDLRHTRATVVLPVPGWPVKPMCSEGGSVSSPIICRARSTW